MDSALLFPYHHHHATMSSSQAQLTSLANEDFARLDAEERWRDALERYREETGRDLLNGHSFAEDILSQSSIDGVMEQFTKFKNFRSSGRRIMRVVKPIVSVVIRFIDAGAEAGSVCASPLPRSDLHSLLDRKLLLAVKLYSSPSEHFYRYFSICLESSSQI